MPEHSAWPTNGAVGNTRVTSRVVAVVFADLVGFTQLSERLDAEDVTAIQQAYTAQAR